MGQSYDGIDDRLAEWIGRQHMFFVATAPRSTEGHVNLSPKGLDTFTILDSHTVAYLDLTGSGVETIAHLRENGRITIMFCAFEGPPRIVRLQGRGEVFERGAPGFSDHEGRFPPRPSARSIIKVTVDRVADSCGFGVPRYRFEADRDALDKWAAGRSDAGLAAYRADNNAVSIDGLPGLQGLVHKPIG